MRIDQYDLEYRDTPGQSYSLNASFLCRTGVLHLGTSLQIIHMRRDRRSTAHKAKKMLPLEQEQEEEEREREGRRPLILRGETVDEVKE